MIKIVINDKEIETDENMNLLSAVLENDIFIPNLCFSATMKKPPVSCRLCYVEIDENEKPVPACSAKVRDGMIIRTDTQKVRHLQKSAFELLMSNHIVDCGNCRANRKCELQKIAKYLHVPIKQKKLEQLEMPESRKESHPFLDYDRSKCVLCGKCVNICRENYGSPFLSFAGRGLDTVISFFNETDAEKIPCGNCFKCVNECPVGALSGKAESKNFNRF